jgi:hypothetical protein
MFPVNASDLFTLNYKYIFPGYYLLQSATPKIYHPNLELASWNLQKYGTSWKFDISEKDQQEVSVRTIETTTQYASNFGFDVGFDTIVKLGFKYGSSETTTQKITSSITTYLNSDDLGEAIYSFDEPIILNSITNWGPFVTREVSTGWVSLEIQPKKVR